MRRLFAFSTVLLLAAPAWADFDDGLAAYDRGDYGTAFEEFLPLAEQGDAWPQILLGAMYYFGEGVEKDYAEAMKWYLLAAEKGNEVARVALDEIASEMTHDQIAEAQRLAAEWWEDYQSRQ
ncbi:MAG: hypothetical protein CMM46_10230 [Rhodospirillaceae bacterium]|nr:hypothetical protein [Rhodospirillaceae bacterium]|tara:strand:- start:1605 stop:1970 length:366 start_codon:yes stop_codon:yes gene_type:complete